MEQYCLWCFGEAPQTASFVLHCVTILMLGLSPMARNRRHIGETLAGHVSKKDATDTISSLQCISICSAKACLLLLTKATLASGSTLILDPEPCQVLDMTWTRVQLISSVN